MESTYFFPHMPGSVANQPKAVIAVETVEALLETAWFKRFSERENFCGFAYSEHPDYLDIPSFFDILALYNNGAEWWVVGYINKPCGIKDVMPEWKAPESA